MVSRVRIKLKPEPPKPTPRPRIRLPRDASILDAFDDPDVFKPFFKNPQSWSVWKAIIAAIFALDMSDEQLALYRQVSGRTQVPTNVAKEVYLILGRRGGKSRILALVAVWLAAFFDYSEHLVPGEQGVIQIIAADRKQARTVVRYVKAFIGFVPMLKRLIESETKESVSLANNISIEVVTASFKSVRGFTVVAALLDEAAYFPNEESANPDVEILNAVKPSMLTIPNSMLLVASSPYSKKGILYDAHKKHFGVDGDPILVFQASTEIVNPTANAQTIADAYLEDPSKASAEYGALFRSDIEGYVSRDAVDACIARGVFERGPIARVKYTAFTDFAGGSGKDSATLAISHRDADSLILDCLREVRPPFSPEATVAEFAQTCKTYRISKIIGDRFGGEFPREMFSKNGIQYEVSVKPKSDLYRDLLPIINSRRCELLDDKRLIVQLTSLERRTARGGRDSIDHAPNSHDDVANSCAGAMVAIFMPMQKLRMGFLEGPCAGGPPGYEVDPKTCKPIVKERVWGNALKPGPHQGCIPGRGIDTRPFLSGDEALAHEFNRQRGITEPKRETLIDEFNRRHSVVSVRGRPR